MLRSVGYKLSLGQRGGGRASKHSLASRKGAVTKLWKKKGLYLDERKSVWKHVEAGSDNKFRFAGSKVRTPTGFFVKVPKGIRKRDYRLKFKGSVLTVDTYIRGSKRVRHDTIIPLKASRIVRGAERYIKQELKKIDPKGLANKTMVRIMVNGWDSIATYDFKQIGQYMADLWRDDFRDEGYSAEEFEDTFHLKVLGK